MKILKSLLVIIFIFGCANQLPPSGGDVDKIPPEIIEIFPSDGTVNFDQSSVLVVFSEYVDKQSVREAIFISPEIEGEIEYDWSGTELEISFVDGLKDSTTYIMSIGTDVTDINNRNKMTRSAMLSFSTGPKIDRGEISGCVFGSTRDGVMIFAYRNPPDTLNPAKDKPAYISQTGSMGRYKLSGLASGLYRVFAIKDEYKDMLYNVEEDLYGAPHKEVVLTPLDSTETGINFVLTREDTTRPHLLGITMTDRNHIMLEFSEPIDSSKISRSNILISDTLNNSFSVKYFYKKDKTPKYIAVIKDSLVPANEYSLMVNNFYDKNGNCNKKELLNFIASDKPDTLKPAFPKIITEYQKNEIRNEKPEVRFEFQEAFDNRRLFDYVKVEDEKGNIIPFDIKIIDDAKFDIKILRLLKNKSEISFSINMAGLSDAAGNFLDTIWVGKANVFDGLNFSGASGKIEFKEKTKPVLNIKNTNSNKIYSANIEADGIFEFKKVEPGNYLMWAFFDADTNLQYNSGDVYPFSCSERIEYFPDTLKLRARWPVGEINWTID